MPCSPFFRYRCSAIVPIIMKISCHNNVEVDTYSKWTFKSWCMHFPIERYSYEWVLAVMWKSKGMCARLDCLCLVILERTGVDAN